MILAASRAGVVELIDPATLETVGRIHFDFPQPNAGLNGVSASRDGSVLYVEGPNQSDPHSCCVLYSVELATLRMDVVASFAGTRSRNAFVMSGGVTYAGVTFTSQEAIEGVAGDRWHLSPDGRWLFGVRRFRGPALDVYDTFQRRIVRKLVPANQDEPGWTTGTWSDDHFYYFAVDMDGSGRLWTVSPETTQLDAGVPVAAVGQTAGCRESAPLVDIVAVGGNVFLYEMFGSKVDRRDGCHGVPGGAWLIDPVTGQLSRQIAPDLHFSELLADPDGTTLYGLVPADASWSKPTPLVRINGADGRILQSRLLDRSVWRIALAPLRVVPHGDVRVSGP
jgi:hypothetical protein